MIDYKGILAEIGALLLCVGIAFALGNARGRNSMKPEINKLEETIQEMKTTSEILQISDRKIKAVIEKQGEKINEQIKQEVAGGIGSIESDYQRLLKATTTKDRSGSKGTDLPITTNISSGTDGTACEMELFDRKEATINSYRLMKLQDAINQHKNLDTSEAIK